MTFDAPVKDMIYNIAHLTGWTEVSALPVYDAVGIEDVDAALTEFARFVSEEIAPLNMVGDQVGSTYEDGRVTLPAGFTEAYAKFVEMGWQSLPHPEEFGGQGLPRSVGAAATEMLNAANMSFALCPLLTEGAIEALLTAATDEQKATYLENLVPGNWTVKRNLT